LGSVSQENNAEYLEMKLQHLSSCPIYVESIILSRPDRNPQSFNAGGTGELKADTENPSWVQIPITGADRFCATWSFSLKITYRVDRRALGPNSSRAVAKLSADLEKQFLSGETSDMAFEIGDEVIPAHKYLLTARVPAFEKLFASGMKESETNRIRIDDADAAAFKHVLKFLYCGKFPDDLEDFAESLLPIAEKYDIQDLKEACAFALEKNLSRDNVAGILVAAHLYQCPDLKKASFKRLAEWKASFDKDKLEIMRPYPDLLIEAVLST